MFAAYSPVAAPPVSGVRRLEPTASSYREMRDSLVALTRDGSLAPGQPVLVDLRAVRFLPTGAEAEALADEFSSTDSLGSHPVALVVQLGAQFGVARMICTMAELRGGRVKTFTDDRVAVDWLMG